ncbi:hypothetical protein GH714_011145 [Hevea brasiliensis]|uniref:Reverse transcriptase Ty1/copia-type domain-containing protein n=1 Tax=Hevea brasiliensis TaxID=3981 RepID=A0A6A6NGJ1_HEVBR|nr:hypothetical protein GH714_011145 [Hevea brasiliensis]
MIARDVVVNEQAFWNWESKSKLHSNDSLKGRQDATSRLHVSYEDGSDSEVDYPILKIRSLAEIYERCNMVNMEPSNYQEASKFLEWQQAMEDEIAINEKNKTWELIAKPKEKHVIRVKFMNSPSNSHFMTAKRVLKYLKGTSNYGVLYLKNENAKLEGYVDSDWAGNAEEMKSTSGYLFFLGSSPFSWISKKQEVVAQSTVEAEYIQLLQPLIKPFGFVDYLLILEKINLKLLFFGVITNQLLLLQITQCSMAKSSTF